jgi:hypothetical protein
MGENEKHGEKRQKKDVKEEVKLASVQQEMLIKGREDMKRERKKDTMQ